MKVLLAGALVGLVAANTQAAVISVQPVVAGYFDTNFNPIPAPDPLPIGGTDNTEFPTVVQIDVMLQVHALSPGEDSFGIAAFSFQFGSAFSSMTVDPIIPDPDAGGWAPNPHPNVDSNGPAPGGVVPLFSTNADLGVDSMDLQGILVSMATGAFTNSFDPRRNIGEGGQLSWRAFLPGQCLSGMEWN